jgi:hypothetical protein
LHFFVGAPGNRQNVIAVKLMDATEAKASPWAAPKMVTTAPGGYDETPPWPTPAVARYPWEEAEWFAVN